MKNTLLAFEFLGNSVSSYGDIEASTIAEVDGKYFDKDTGEYLFLDDVNGLFIHEDCSKEGWRLEQKGNMFFLVNFFVVSNSRDEHIEDILYKCPVFFPSYPIKRVSRDEALQIIETRSTKGRFLFEESAGNFVGIDNSTKDAWTEEFSSIKDCFFWLAGEEIDLSARDFKKNKPKEEISR